MDLSCFLSQIRKCHIWYWKRNKDYDKTHTKPYFNPLIVQTLKDSESNIWPIDIIVVSTCSKQNAAEKLPSFMPSWTAVYVVNAFIVVWVLVVGFGFGGWASMTNFIKQVDTFGLFAKCYQCQPHAPPSSSPPLPAHHWCWSSFCMTPKKT